MTPIHDRFQVQHDRYGFIAAFSRFAEAIACARCEAKRTGESYTVFDCMARRGRCELFEVAPDGPWRCRQTRQ